MESESDTTCPHCGKPLAKWANPSLGTWSGEFQYVCFNDECPYFVRGWVWMKDKFNVKASYRHRFNPVNREAGPLPVWSREALKSGILSGEGSPHE